MWFMTLHLLLGPAVVLWWLDELASGMGKALNKEAGKERVGNNKDSADDLPRTMEFQTRSSD